MNEVSEDHTSNHTLTPAQLKTLCVEALLRVGASQDTAEVMASATVAAEQRGKLSVGVRHLLDYLAALREGRLVPDAKPRITDTGGSVILADAVGGTVHLAFEQAYDLLVERAQAQGIAVLSISNAFTAGELGYYVARLTEQKLVAFACSNAPAVVSLFGAGKPVTGTNPIAFGVPDEDGPRIFDQAVSETAWVNIRAAAERGETIPEGWAIDADGKATESAQEAINGTLLPFGGVKGANIAMMVELLSVLSGGIFSDESEDFGEGKAPMRMGAFILALDSQKFAPDYLSRITSYFERLSADYGLTFGRRKALLVEIEISAEILQKLRD